MIPVSALPAPAEYALLKITLEGKDADTLRVIERKDIIETPRPAKRLKPQQAVADVILRLFGFDSLSMYYEDNAFMQMKNDVCRQVIEMNFNGYTGSIARPVQMLREFKRNSEVASNGKIHKNNVSDYRSELTTALKDEDVISFSKVLDGKEVMIVYNTSETDAKEKFILTGDHNINAGIKKMNIVYGYDPCGNVHLFNGRYNGQNISYIKIYLKPLQLLVLKNY